MKWCQDTKLTYDKTKRCGEEDENMENMENRELNMEELEDVTGGKISFKKRPDKAGWTQHQVVKGDTLIRIANHYGISNWRKIIEWNPHINPKTNMIINGEWLWIKL